MKRFSSSFLVGVGLVLVLSGCESSSSADDKPTDPRDGWVEVDGDDIMKKCDGTTLMYRFQSGSRSGFDAIPDSSECILTE